MRQKALGRKYSEETKLLMATKKGFSIDVYEIITPGDVNSEFKFIGNFVSARRVGIFLVISATTVRRYLVSNEIFNNKYKFVRKN
jgi:hypothetical protein